MIDSCKEHEVDTDMFFLTMGGWDTHGEVLDNLNHLFADVNALLKAFADKMMIKGAGDSVAVIVISDFAQTLAPNTGRGSDHVW